MEKKSSKKQQDNKLIPFSQPALKHITRQDAGNADTIPEQELEMLRKIADMADLYAQHTVFAQYHKKRARNTRIRQVWDLKSFATFCLEAGEQLTDSPFATDVVTLTQALFLEVSTWKFVTAGLVRAYVTWLERSGYAIQTINVRISTVKRYCRLAGDANILSSEEIYRISRVQSFRHKEGRNIDRERPVTRVGAKKAEPNALTEEQARLLKTCHDLTTKEGRRAQVILCLLLDLGLRVGELVSLTLKNVRLTEGLLHFYREKVDTEQTHRLSSDCIQALRRYLPDVQGQRFLFPGYKGSHMSTRMVEHLLKDLGDMLGIDHLSPHDCRHYWITYHTAQKKNIGQLQRAGGWSSPAMVLKYYVASEIANEGLLSDEPE